MSDDDKLRLCRGCTDDFYNNHNPIGVKRCWSFATAEPVTRWRIGWWSDPTKPGAFVEVETLSCHRAPGEYAQSEKLPSHAVEPVDLVPLRRSREVG